MLNGKIVEKTISDLIAENNLKIEALTKKQFASALIQAIACGDFQRLITKEPGSQLVTYEPYRAKYYLDELVKELKMQVEELQEENNALKI